MAPTGPTNPRREAKTERGTGMSKETARGTWYVASDNKGVLFCMTAEGYATDVLDRVWSGTAPEAQKRCAEANRDKAWRIGGIQWHYAPIATLEPRMRESRDRAKV